MFALGNDEWGALWFVVVVAVMVILPQIPQDWWSELKRRRAQLQWNRIRARAQRLIDAHEQTHREACEKK